jgi:glycosyltransferase involved in cell wall biosynthesis
VPNQGEDSQNWQPASVPAVNVASAMRAIRVVSFVEGHTLTGPIRPLLSFAKHVSTPGFSPPIQSSFVTTSRQRGNSISTDFLDAARAQHTEVDVLFERHTFDGRLLGQLRAVLDLRKPDIVETHSFKPHFLISLLRNCNHRFHKLNWIAFHHGYTGESLKVRLYNQFDRWSLPRADRVITLCAPFAKELIHHRGVDAHRIEIIKNAIEPRPPATAREISQLRADLGITANEIVILTVGRLSPEKGHIDLIRAFKELVGGNNALPLRLLIVGDGVERVALAAASASLGKKVLLVGHRNEIWPFYGLARVFALPSYSEGSPMVIFEAMLAGLPIVATSVGGVPETLRDGQTALLLPPRDSHALRVALERLLTDDALAAELGRAAGAAVEQYSAERYCRRLSRIYESIAAQSSIDR